MTGGASGIGAALAAKMKAQGHAVTSFDIAEPEGVDEWIETDLSDPVSIERALRVVEGPFDALINNAGLPPREGQAELVLRVNWFGFQQFLDGMLDKLGEGAAIVNTASRAGAMWRDNLKEVQALRAIGIDGLADFVTEYAIDATRAYNLSKEAVIVMTLARAEEMIKRGLRMNSVSPAAVSTGILDDFVKAFGPRVAANIARAGRAGTAEEVANLVTFLASPESGWIKGQNIAIDGGMSAMAISDTLEL
ncbi:SDR family oxidoreductase [Aliisedimentitalea sp. MJ-SS2]|uniref:SDR family oxidoreductase n=1 Tax=Aliisedimentitalea sp. MJ-SS2 TaxID=3049795 RepID=UPI002931C10C|nr:SDR family oxidoreductase [Alisedimentitalea sp. MJ-SS2]